MDFTMDCTTSKCFHRLPKCDNGPLHSTCSRHFAKGVAICCDCRDRRRFDADFYAHYRHVPSDYVDLTDHDYCRAPKVHFQGPSSSKMHSGCSGYVVFVSKDKCSGQRKRHYYCNFHKDMGIPKCCACRDFVKEREIKDELRRRFSFKPRSQFVPLSARRQHTTTSVRLHCLEFEISRIGVQNNELLDQARYIRHEVQRGEMDWEIEAFERHENNLAAALKHVDDALMRVRLGYDNLVGDVIHAQRAVEYQGQGQSTSAGNTPIKVRTKGNVAVNIYGTSYTGSAGSQSQVVDPTAPIDALTASLPLGQLHDPKVEEQGFSDRMGSIRAGVTNITSQSSLESAVVAYGFFPNYVDNSDACCYTPTKPGGASDRFYRCGSVDWDASKKCGDILIQLDFPKALAKKGIFGQNLDLHWLVRCGFCFVVTVSASHFHGGAIGCFAIPEAERSSEQTTAYPEGVCFQQLPVFPHQVINLRVTNTAVIFCPYWGATPQSPTRGHNWVSLYVSVLAPLRVGSDASQIVKVTVDVAPMCSQFGAIRSSVGTQGVATILSPGSGQCITTINQGGVPIGTESHRPFGYFLPGRVQNLCQVVCMPTFILPKRSTSTDVNSCLSISMTAVNGRLEACVQNILLTTEYIAGRCTLAGTLLAGVVSSYIYYSGTIWISLTFTGPLIVQGKLVVCYIPPGGAYPETYCDCLEATRVVWDFGLQPTLRFPVPFASPSSYRYRANENTLCGSVGAVFIYAYSPFSFPAGVSPMVDIIMEASADKDFKAHFLVDPQGDVHINDADAPALGTSGVGVEEVPDVEQVIEAHAQRVEIPKGLDVENYFSPHVSLGAVTLKSGGECQSINLDFDTESTYLKSKLHKFTYGRFDLDIIVVQASSLAAKNVRFEVKWQPPGDPRFPTSPTDDWWAIKDSAVIFINSNATPATFRLPYCVPSHYFSFSWNGYKASDSGTYGVSGFNTFGKLWFRPYLPSGGLQDEYRFTIVAAPVNVEMYMPRPWVNNEQKLVKSIEISTDFWADDDLPGVDDLRLQYEGPVAWIESFFSFVGESLGTGVARSVRTEIGEKLSNVKEIYWQNICYWLVKFVSSCLIIARHKDDPLTISAVSIGLGVDLLHGDPVNHFVKMIGSKLGVEYQGPKETFQTLSAALSCGRGIEWLHSVVMRIVAKIQEMMDGTARREQEAVDRIDGFLESVNLWDRVERESERYDEKSIRELAEYILRFKEWFIKSERSDPMLCRLCMEYARKAGKYLRMTKPRQHEPVCVVFHGSPGSGKTLMSLALCRVICERFGWSDVYSLPPDPDHFDGYNGQQCVLLDDLGQNPDGNDCALFCQMLSTARLVTPQADLSDKGQPFTASLVVATTNQSDIVPRTISCPEAMARRFDIDLDVQVNHGFRAGNGVNTSAALTPCSHGSKNFKKCCPLFCGLACVVVDKKTGVKYSLDDLVSLTVSKIEEKRSCASAFEVLFQGPTLKEKRGQSKPATAEIVDLLRAVPTPDVIKWVEDQGYIIPCTSQATIVRSNLEGNKHKLKMLLLGLAGVVAVASGIILAWKMLPVEDEGAYSSERKSAPKPPVRRVKVEGGSDPDADFANSIMRRNMGVFSEGDGNFTFLGIKSNIIVVPTHAYSGAKEVFINGQRVVVEDAAQLVSSGTLVTELTILWLKGINSFRDITKFLPMEPRSGRDYLLCLQSPMQAVIPVRSVKKYGTLNISGNLTANCLVYDCVTRKGWCGGILMKAGMIVGLHIAGDGQHGYAAALCRSYFHFLDVEHQAALKDTGEKCNIFTPCHTAYYPTIWQEIRKPNKEPAVLHPNDPRCKVDFDVAFLSKYNDDFSAAIDDETLGVAIESYFSNFVHKIDARELTFEEATQGCDGLEAIDLKTSGGFVCLGGLKKGDFVASREIWERHVDNEHPFITFKKDELRRLDKIESGKTRAIEAQSVDGVILWRIKFGSVMRYFHMNPGIETGSAVGADPDIFWTYLVKNLPMAQGMDFKNFDATVPAKVLVRSLSRLGQILDLDLSCMVAVFNCRKHVIHNKVYEISGGVPSGCAATSIVNTIVNNVLFRYVLLKAFKGIQLAELKMVAYGDDNLVQYPFPLEMEIIKEEYEEIGMAITPPDKGSFFPEPGIFNMTFLKRGFQRDGRYPFLIHPIYDVDEAMDSLCWTRDSESIQQHIWSLCYLVWHSGEEVYRHFLEFVQKPVLGRHYNVIPYVVLMREWLDKF
uniref:Genome polyprotein n=1 Tax=Avocet picornavirus TaxID=2212755 RepID=A0A3G1RP79_9VIRU|nr:MAG: polyprotein [Avocet picornavirus]